MDHPPNRLGRFIEFLAWLLLEAMVFPKLILGLRRAEASEEAGEYTAGALRWFVRVLLAPVELVAHIMTFLGMGVATVWGLMALAACLIYVVLAAIQFLDDGSLLNPMLLIEYLARGFI